MSRSAGLWKVMRRYFIAGAYRLIALNDDVSDGPIGSTRLWWPVARFEGSRRAAVCVFALAAIANVTVPCATAVELSTLDGFVVPDKGDSLEVYGVEQYVYDDNLYRLPAVVANLDGVLGHVGSRGDRINSITAGSEGQWISGLQEAAFNIRVDRNEFADNGLLDNTSGSGKIVWDWISEGHWLGEVGANFARSLAGFANIKFYQRDLVDQTEYFGNAQFMVASQWKLVAGIRKLSTTNDNRLLVENDLNRKTGTFGVQYVTAADNIFGWDYRHTDGSYPYEVPTAVATGSQNYQENSAQFSTRYLLGGKTQIEASAGYLKRDYTYTQGGNFSGDVGRGKIQWQLSPKFLLLFSGWRELTAYFDSQSQYYVSSGGSVGLTWHFSDMLSASLSDALDKQNYINSIANEQFGMLRHDRLNSKLLSLSWTPRQYLSARFSYGIEGRESNLATFRYDDKLATVNITLTF